MPAAPQPPAAALTTRPDLSPALSIGRLLYDQRISFDGRTVYTFWIGGRRPSRYEPNRPKDLATIALFRNDTFTLSYYPKDSDQIQITERLSIDRLPAAVQDLCDAGFPTAPVARPSSSPPSPPPPPVRRSPLLPP